MQKKEGEQYYYKSGKKKKYSYLQTVLCNSLSKGMEVIVCICVCIYVCVRPQAQFWFRIVLAAYSLADFV